jgi:hypothetical protein
MKDVLADTVPALRALAVAFAGVIVANLWFDGDWPVAVGLLVALVVLGYLIEAVGERFLPEHPVAAAYLMEWWIIIPMAIAVAGSAAVIVAAVELAVPDDVKDPVVKETGGAVAAGITAFLSAAFVSNIGDKDKSGVGDRIKTRLRRHYERAPASGKSRMTTIPAGGEIEQLLYSNFYDGLEGWDRETRLERARGISKARLRPPQTGHRSTAPNTQSGVSPMCR